MNNKELIAALSKVSGIDRQQVEQLLETTVKICSDELLESKTISFQGFGNFEVKKREERLSVHPATQVRTLIPPKLVVAFKMSTLLKEKLQTVGNHE